MEYLNKASEETLKAWNQVGANHDKVKEHLENMLSNLDKAIAEWMKSKGFTDEQIKKALNGEKYV